MKTKRSISQEALKALREAVRHLIEEHRETGQPVIIWRNGRVVKESPGRLLRKLG